MAVMDTAKNCLNFQKERKSVFSFLTKFAVSNLVMWEVRYFFVISFSVGVPIISATVLFLINKGIKMAMAGTINYFCNTIVSRANNYQSNEKINDIKMTLDIVPTNIKVGENLEGVDATPIFKEGKYVIIKSSINPYFIRVVEDEKGEEKAYSY